MQNENNTTAPAYVPIEDLIERNKRAGKHFFDKPAMRFFSSRVMDETFTSADGWTYFVTSERCEGICDKVYPRMYTVRRMDAAGELETMGEFQQYKSRSGAMAAAKRMAAEVLS